MISSLPPRVHGQGTADGVRAPALLLTIQSQSLSASQKASQTLPAEHLFDGVGPHFPATNGRRPSGMSADPLTLLWPTMYRLAAPVGGRAVSVFVTLAPAAA